MLFAICYFLHFLKIPFLNFLTRKGEGREGNMRMPKGSQWSPLERAAGQDSVSWNLQDIFFYKIVWPMKEILTILMILMKMWIIFCGCWVPKLEDPWRLISLHETATTTHAKLKKNQQTRRKTLEMVTKYFPSANLITLWNLNNQIRICFGIWSSEEIALKHYIKVSMQVA